MSKIVYNMSMSLDGFVTSAGRTPETPLGVSGERLHEWGAEGADPRSLALIEENAAGVGAMITGRGTYDDSLPWWGPDGPTGAARIPLFVLTHRADPGPDPDSVYEFVTDGVESVVARARAAAGDKEIAVSGVEIGRVLLQSGHLDEIWIHVTPLLFGDGTRLYEQMGADPIDLELLDSVATPQAVHLRYRVVRRNAEA